MLQIRHGLFIAVIALGLGRLALRTEPAAGAGAPAHGSTAHSSGSSHSAASQRARQARAWRNWYNRYRRVIRPGYYYPPGYPPGYTPNSTPTTGPSGGENNGVVGVSPNGGNNGALFNNNAVNAPAAADVATSTPQVVDPDVLAAVARVKTACMARSDYQAALSDKKTAEDRLAALRPDGQDIDPAIAMPLAKAALDASMQMSAIELEETTKDAQTAGLPPQTKPGEAATK